MMIDTKLASGFAGESIFSSISDLLTAQVACKTKYMKFVPKFFVLQIFHMLYSSTHHVFFPSEDGTLKQSIHL
jgi:hypothetical protein